MVNWKNIHLGFDEKDWKDETYQQKWENYNLTYQDAKSWINLGLTPKDYEFALYLKQNNHQLSTTNLEIAEKEFQDWLKIAQNYLDFFYPKNGACLRKDEAYGINNYNQTRQEITKLNISEKNLQGSLNLAGFVNLEMLSCSYNQLANLNFFNDLNAEILTKLYISNNEISNDLTLFSKFINLVYLDLRNNSFYGSLKPLARLVKLKLLDIRDTDIDSGLEYLPESVEKFCCLAWRKDVKVKAVYNLFTNGQGGAETEQGYIKKFPQKLQDYKQWRKLKFSEEEIKSWLNNGAKWDDYGFVAWLRDIKKLVPKWEF